MSTATLEPAATPPVAAAPPKVDRNERLKEIGESLLRWGVAIFAAVLIFSAILMTRGANPIDVFTAAWQNTIMNPNSVEQILIKTGPIALAALAVVIPAAAGLCNVGGEGQLIVGAVAAGGVALAFDQKLSGGLVILLMALAGMAAGALWSGIAAILRTTAKVNEAVSTLLLNYIALDLLLALIYAPWKDPEGSGQPATRPLADTAKLPIFNGTAVNVGILVVLIATLVTWFALRGTTWGFRLATVGGNPEAARRAGFPVTALLLSAMLAGGALAGLGGMLHFAGTEYQLRPGLLATMGYTAFLASWLAKHKPIPVLFSSMLFAALIVAGDSLQIDSGLPAASINILTGLILIAVLGWTTVKSKKGA